MELVFSIAKQFDLTVSAIHPLGNGLINDTFLVSTANSPFVLQRINSLVFKCPVLIIENLEILCRHVESKDRSNGILQVPRVLKTRENKSFVQDSLGNFWRAITYITNADSIETISSVEEAEQVGHALGQFHLLVCDLEPNLLHDTLPGFHITPGYLAHYHDVKTMPLNLENSKDMQFCANFIESFQLSAGRLEFAKDEGLLPLRVIHGDPKLNNFLFDKSSGRIVSIIDLDTVKPGLIHYDIGDCLRSCCHRPENDSFELAICEAILKGYLSQVQWFLSDQEYNYLYTAIELIPFELGLRFFTDYLENNRYFKVVEPRQNLKRACAQFRLCINIRSKQQEIEQLINSFLA